MKNRVLRLRMPAVQPMSAGAKTATVGGLGMAMALALIAQWEGKSNDPYRDIVGVLTVCYGETNVEMRHYTDAECLDMLRDSAGEYGAAVLRRNPALEGRPYQFAAATSLSYNVGNGAYAKSTAAKRFDRGDWAGGCKAMTWFNRAGGKVVKGLVNRRADEYRLCMTDL